MKKNKTWPHIRYDSPVNCKHVLATVLLTETSEPTGIALKIAAVCEQVARNPEIYELQCWPRVQMDAQSGGPLLSLPRKQRNVR